MESKGGTRFSNFENQKSLSDGRERAREDRESERESPRQTGKRLFFSRARTPMAPLLLPLLPRAAPLAPARPRSSDGSRRASLRRAEEGLSRRCDDALSSNRRPRRRPSQRAFASPPSPSNEGDEVVQETLAEMIRLQVGAEEVKEFVEQESEKLRESAEKVGREDDEGGEPPLP